MTTTNPSSHPVPDDDSGVEPYREPLVGADARVVVNKGSTATGSDDHLSGEPLNDDKGKLPDDDAEFCGDELDEDGHPRRRSPNRELFCFSCNRLEDHSLAHRKEWPYSLLVGMTFGLILFFGPFRCRCCGHTRLMLNDFLNPKYWIRPESRGGRARNKYR